MAPDNILESHTLLGDLAWDMFDDVECVMEIEEHFGVSVPDEISERAKTVGDIVDAVLMLLADQPKG